MSRNSFSDFMPIQQINLHFTLVSYAFTFNVPFNDLQIKSIVGKRPLLRKF